MSAADVRNEYRHPMKTIESLKVTNMPTKLNQTMCRLTVPARERILAAGGTVGPAENGCWEIPDHLYAVRLGDARGLGLVYVQTPADWDPAGHLTSAIRCDDEPAYPGESHMQPL